MHSEDRPWGSFHNLLDDELCKVKKIVVKPGERLSLQYHKFRSEHWFCIQGVGVATIGDRRVNLRPGVSVNIMNNEKHRVECPKNEEDLDWPGSEEEKNLIFIEVQTGTYFGEDDIVRLEDDYGR